MAHSVLIIVHSSKRSVCVNIFEQAKEQLMTGIKVYVDRAINTANFDKTYNGFITDREKDSSGNYTGLYSVMINGNVYTGISTLNNAKTFAKGSPVIVLAPMNNFSNLVILN